MFGIPLSKPYRLFYAALMLCSVVMDQPQPALARWPQDGQPPPQGDGLPPSPIFQPAPPEPNLTPLPSPAPQPPPAQPSLVDKLLDILGNNKSLQEDITAPPANTPPRNPARSNINPEMPVPPPPPPQETTNASANASAAPLIEISPNFVPIYSFDKGEDDEETPPVIPFFSTSPINQVHKGVDTIVIMLHDQTREAARAFAYARSAQEEATARHPEWSADKSYIFVPQFLSSEDIAAHQKTWPDGGAALLRWAGNNWMLGGDSITGEQKGIWATKTGPKYNMSSYTVMDFVLLMLARPKLFPNLQKVVIAGTSGGADFVQRYAVLGIAPSVLNDEGIEVRFVPAGARSFLYLDNHRLVEKRDDPLPVKIVEAKIETDAFAPTRPEACKMMNHYPFGLDELPRYGRKNAVNELRLNYSAKRIIYLAGAGATLPIPETTPDACALIAQGGNSRRRSEIFFASLKRLYGDEVDRMQKLYLIQGLNEDGLGIWRSNCGSSALFGDGACNASDVGGKAMQIIR